MNLQVYFGDMTTISLDKSILYGLLIYDSDHRLSQHHNTNTVFSNKHCSAYICVHVVSSDNFGERVMITIFGTSLHTFLVLRVGEVKPTQTKKLKY